MIHKYSYKAYFSGFGMEGLGDIPAEGQPPIIYMAVPKDLKFASILADVSVPENVPYIHKAKFMKVALIPVYELCDIV